MILPITKAYFAFLCPEKDPIITTTWMLEGENSGVVKGYGTVHCKVSELVNIWNQIGAQKVSCHTTLNRTDLKGRKSENIESVRVFCVDLDRQIEKEEFQKLVNDFKPGLVVESSPGKYHFYWKAAARCPLERWSQIQTALAYTFQGDYTLAHKTHIIRVPGFKRICKDGRPFVPKPVHEAAKGEAKIIENEPWIEEAIAKGSEEAKEEMRRVLSLAKKVILAKGDSDTIKGTIKHSLSEVSQGSRNVTLYAAARGYTETFTDGEVRSFECSEDNQTYTSAVAWGLSVNESFESPLQEREAKSAVDSGLRHGVKAKLKKVAQKERLAALLAAPDDAEMVELVRGGEQDNRAGASGNGNGNGNGKSHCNGAAAAAQKEEESSAVGSAIGSASEDESGEPLYDLTWSQIPNSVDSAAARLVDLIASVELEAAVVRLAAAIELKSYNEYVKYLCEKFKLVGCYRKTGPAIFVREKTRWGSLVKYPVTLDEKAATWFISRVVSDLGLRALTIDKLKDKLKNPPKTSITLAIAILWWKAAISQEVRDRQRPEMIVFQNGVLEFCEKKDAKQITQSTQSKPTAVTPVTTGVFKADEYAPIKYSHPIWCYYHKRVAAAFHECMEKGWSIEELVKTACPKFWKYAQDWFPNDIGIISVLLNWFGYSFTTDACRQKFMFFYGPTRSGKGSLCRTMCALAGWHNYSSSDYSALDGGFKGANMFDKLIITMEETEGTATEHDKRMGHLKKLIGGERVTFERKYQQPFEDAVIGKFVLQANEIPDYQDKGHAIRARMIAVGFEHSFEDSGTTVDPAQVILDSEADKLATIAALLWSENYRNAECFRNASSRAIQLGLTEVIKGLDVVGDIIKNYITADLENKDMFLVTEAAIELVQYAAEDSDKKLSVKVSHAVNRELKFLYPTADTSRRNNKRGYVGLQLNRDAILKRFPELLSSEARINQDILVLLDELKLLASRTEIQA